MVDNEKEKRTFIKKIILNGVVANHMAVQDVLNTWLNHQNVLRYICCYITVVTSHICPYYQDNVNMKRLDDIISQLVAR